MYENVILVLLGKRGAGKTALAKIFKECDKYNHIEMSQYLNSIKLIEGKSEILLRTFVEQVHKARGKKYFIKKLNEDSLQNSQINFVLTGVRHLQEIEFLKENITHSKLLFIYLKVNFWNRLTRILKREQRNSIKEFLIEEFYSMKWGDIQLQNVSMQVNANRSLNILYREIKIIAEPK